MLVVLLGCLLVTPLCSCLKPVILVPGTLGSQIEAKLNRTETAHFYCSQQSDWYLIWATLHHLLLPQIHCWADNFQLHFKDGKFSNTPGVTLRVRGFGRLEGLRHVDNLGLIPYYNTIITQLLKVPGMQAGVSLRGAPFDYRYSPPSTETKAYFLQLEELIEDTYKINNEEPVALVSHSMGSLVISTFLSTVSKQWKSKYIHSWSSLGGVFGGAPKLVKALVSHGVIDELPDFLSGRFLQRHVARTIMSNYWLLPRYPIWGEREVLLHTPNANYTVSNLDKMFSDMGDFQGEETWKIVRSTSYVGDPEVKTFCFNGKDISTTTAYFYEEQAEFPDSIPAEVKGLGDGTVPDRSLQVCHKWRSTQQVHEYTAQQHGSHIDVLNNPHIIQHLIHIISEDCNTNT